MAPPSDSALLRYFFNFSYLALTVNVQLLIGKGADVVYVFIGPLHKLRNYFRKIADLH